MSKHERPELDIDANRASTKWTLQELMFRVLWRLAFPLFRFSPRPLWIWRRFMLRAFGATIGKKCHIYPTSLISFPWNIRIGEMSSVGDRAILYPLGLIDIGPRSTVSQGAHLCAGTHDVDHPERPLIKAKISIGADVWVAADAFIGPDVIVGDGAVIGARAVVVRDVKAGRTVVGNPAGETQSKKTSSFKLNNQEQ